MTNGRIFPYERYRWANRHTGDIDVFTKGRKFIHIDIEPTQIGRVYGPDFAIVSDAKAALSLLVEAEKLMQTHKMPVVVEVILERVTNISMGTRSIDDITEWEPAAQSLDDAPTAIT